jgi:hypothetical protein
LVARGAVIENGNGFDPITAGLQDFVEFSPKSSGTGNFMSIEIAFWTEFVEVEGGATEFAYVLAIKTESTNPLGSVFTVEWATNRASIFLGRAFRIVEYFGLDSQRLETVRIHFDGKRGLAVGMGLAEGAPIATDVDRARFPG